MSERTFCIAGPIDPEYHYFVPHRLDWNEIGRLIRNREYFVLHAPRQSGKTTAIIELCRRLNSEGVYNAIYINVESAQAVRENVKEGLLVIVKVLLMELSHQLPQEKEVLDFLEKNTADGAALDFNMLHEALAFLAEHSSKPIVLFIDEIDSLIGDTLLSVLRQIRAGFINRPKRYPHSLCLIGLRDVRDYRIWSKQEGHHISTASPFNIKAKSLVLANFTLDDVITLYNQHTRETGQPFLPEAAQHAYDLSCGQPWLVNALAYEACYEDVKNLQSPITKEVIERAKDALIKRRDTHIDSLLDKLRDPRVSPIIEAIIIGETDPSTIKSDDLQYVCDLGLVRQDSIEIANPIYREIIPRELTSVATRLITETSAPFRKPDGTLDSVALIEAFVTFYRENSAIWLEKFDYREAGPHLLIMAFLQRVINGGGTLLREYALGTGRVDILIQWLKQKIVVELKIRHSARSLSDGLQQTAKYMDTSHADVGHLVIFDRSQEKSWEEKIFHLTEIINGKMIHVWGL